MWLLLIVFLIPGAPHWAVLNQFDTWEDCKTERNRIGFEMADAHPYEMDFQIVCWKRARAKIV